jgi:hypothetical protein
MIRPLARKFPLSLAEIANATGKSLSSIKRLSTKDPAALEKMVRSILNGSEEESNTEENDALSLENIADRVCAARTLLRLGIAGEQSLEKCVQYAFKMLDILLADLDSAG